MVSPLIWNHLPHFDFSLCNYIIIITVAINDKHILSKFWQKKKKKKKQISISISKSAALGEYFTLTTCILQFSTVLLHKTGGGLKEDVIGGILFLSANLN